MNISLLFGCISWINDVFMRFTYCQAIPEKPIELIRRQVVSVDLQSISQRGESLAT